MSVGIGRQNYNSVLEKTVLFLGIHKWKPDIYIGFFHRPFICSVMQYSAVNYVENMTDVYQRQTVFNRFWIKREVMRHDCLPSSLGYGGQTK
jgi:hypothetical protein